MKTPKRIEPLIEDGLVDEVLRPLMSGKEAAVYVVRCGNELRCAKVYRRRTNVVFVRPRSIRRVARFATADRPERWPRGRSSVVKRRKMPGRTPKWRRCSGWPVRACGFQSPMTSSKAYC